MKESPVERLLRQLKEQPDEALDLIGRGMGGRNRDAVIAALGSDPRFAPALHRICQDPALLKAAPWVAQFLGRQRYEAAVPALLDAWRRRTVGLSDQAGRAVIEMGDEAGMEAIAADLGELRHLLATVALEAAVALGGAFDRVEPHLGDGHVARAMFGFLGRNRDVFDSDARWLSFAVESLRTGTPEVGQSAQSLLRRILPKLELERLLAERPAETGLARAARPSEAALGRARTAMVGLRDALDPSAWSAPGAGQADQLAAIEATVGPLPAMARAFYEMMDGIQIDAPKPADRFIVYPLREAMETVRAFDRQHSPSTTPRDLLPPFLFPVAPDGYEKAGLSGGPPIGFEMPCDGDDPRLSNIGRTPKLSTFLRRSLRPPKRRKKRVR